MKTRIYRFCAILLIPLMTVLNCPVTGSGATAEPDTISVSHGAADEVTAGERVEIGVEVKDESGVYEVRAYFKAIKAAEYSYVILRSENGEDFNGELPAPANDSGSFEYLILILNGKNRVYKTQTFTVIVENDSDAEKSIEGNTPVKVYTELLQYPAGIEGFADKIVIDMADSRAKLGVVAGLYSSKNAGESKSGAMPGGTVTATDEISSTTVIIASVAVIAALGGALAAGGGGGGGQSETEPEPEPDPDPDPEPEPEPEPEPPDPSFLFGLWYWESSLGDYGTITFTSDGSYSRYGSSAGTISGVWSYSQDNSEHNWLVMTESEGLYSGEAYEDTTPINVVGSAGYSDTLTIYR